MSRAVYLDYMATTPVDQRVVEKMQQYLGVEGEFGNPSSVNHSYGAHANHAVEHARKQVAAVVNADPRTVVWTSGATEAINLAIKGVAYAYHRSGKHIITSMTEHKAVLDCCRYLESKGYEVTYLQPDSEGLIDIAQVEKAIRTDTVLITIMQVNNEIGVVQDIAAIGKLAKSRGILFHVDAAQSPGKVVLDMKLMHIGLLSLSAHKVYGPKGVGALVIRSDPKLHLDPLIHGGGQELGVRSGTLATHQVVGMGEAFALIDMHEIKRIENLRDQLWAGLSLLPGVSLNGSSTSRVAHNLNVSFAQVEGESLLLAIRELAVATGSACTSATVEPSYVLKAIGVSDELAQSAIRFSLGRFTTEADIVLTIEVVTDAVNRLRSYVPF